MAGSPFVVLPHPAAPLFALEANPALVLAQLEREMQGGNLQLTEAFLSILRQACFVNLFFFLRYVASVSGPYEKLQDPLHREMCDFMQSVAAMGPGAHSAIITSRGFYKSTIGCHGSVQWRLVRDPNARCRIVSNIVERAQEFQHIAQRFFDSNPLARELFGSRTFNRDFDARSDFLWRNYVPPRSAPRWNDNEFVLPNRSRYYTEPSCSSGGATGASEGVHVTDLFLDDIAGLDDLGSDRRSNANMQQKKAWFKTNTTTLLVDKKSRTHLNGTFYGSDDVCSAVMDDACSIQGFHDEAEFALNPAGQWTVYYRSWKEGDVVTFPDVMDEAKYEKLLQDDPWSALTQYSNRRHDPALAEFAALAPNRAALVWSEKRSEWWLRRGPAGKPEDNWDELPGPEWTRLGDCDVAMAVDPAGTEKGISAKTSRTAIGIGALDSEERIYLLWCRAGYYAPLKMFDLIFDGCAKFEGLVRMVGVEAAAMQKIIAPLLQRERALRDYYINPQPIAAGGDKEGRIRMNVGRALMRGKVYLVDGEAAAFEEERMVFPGNENRRDVLDMFEKLLVVLRRPHLTSDTDDDDVEDLEYDYAEGRSAVTGY